MKSEQQGWCVVNFKHPASGDEVVYDFTLSGSRKQSVELFLKGTGAPWSYWYKTFNFRCVKVKSIIEVIKKGD